MLNALLLIGTVGQENGRVLVSQTMLQSIGNKRKERDYTHLKEKRHQNSLSDN